MDPEGGVFLLETIDTLGKDVQVILDKKGRGEEYSKG